MKKILWFSLLVSVLVLGGCGNQLVQQDDLKALAVSTYQVNGLVRGVVDGGQVTLGSYTSPIDLNGYYSMTNISKGKYTLKVFDKNNNEVHSEQIMVSSDLTKDISIDLIRATYRRPPVDLVQAKNEIDQYVAYGVTDLYVETFFHGMTIYPSTYATQKSYADDYFQNLIDYAHSKGLRIHAWVETTYWWNLQYLGNPPAGHLLAGTDQVTVNGTTYTLNMDLVTIDKNGEIMVEGGKVFVSPFHPQVVSTLKNIVSEINTKFNVDGIQVDYIRFPMNDAGFGYESVGPYVPGMTDGELHTHRVNAVTNLVQEIGSVISPDKIYSAAVFVWYYTGSTAEHNKSQDWVSWIDTTPLDWINPMCYKYSLTGVNEDLQFAMNAQSGSVTIVPNLAINTGHETIQTQYDQAYVNYNFAGYGVWEASFIDQVLP